jgi:ABC-2 type transport system ATP-binding protein
VGKPSVLFLDEPTAGVDPEGRIVVRDIIAERRHRGICVILTTHELSEAERLADRVVIIDRGRMLADGTPSALAIGTADGSIRFSTDPGIDTAGLALTMGEGATVEEERPGLYRLRCGDRASTPAVVAALTGWLAERDLAVGDLRTGQSLEEAYLAITASRGTADAPASEPSERRHRAGRARAPRP